MGTEPGHLAIVHQLVQLAEYVRVYEKLKDEVLILKI